MIFSPWLYQYDIAIYWSHRWSRAIPKYEYKSDKQEKMQINN